MSPLRSFSRASVLRQMASIGAVATTTIVLSACRDLASFSTAGDHFEGPVVAADFVRVGIDASTRLCLSLDTDHLQDAPGSISSNDGRFQSTPLRPIPQLWHDPLSTFNFGEGRLKNLMYMASPNADGGASEPDVTVVVSLMESNAVEVRVLRGAPSIAPPDAGPAPTSNNVFAIFSLARAAGPCSF